MARNYANGCQEVTVPLANDGAEGSLVGVSGFGVVSTGTEMKEQRKIIVQLMSKEEARVFHQILALIQWLTICVESR